MNQRQLNNFTIETNSLFITVKIIQWISSSSHDSIELIKVKHSISITIRLFHHFFQFLIWNFLSHFICYSFQIFESYFIQIVLIKEFEDFIDFFLRVSWAHFSSHNLNKLIKTETFLNFFSHLGVNISNILFFDFHSKGFHYGFELASINLS